MFTDKLIDKIFESSPLSDEEVKEFALRGIVDYFASSFQAYDSPYIKKMLEFINNEGGKESHWLIGQKRFATARQAALFNGFQAHLLDYDDIHPAVRGHPSAVILSALLGSIDESVSGERFISAYIIGVEMMAFLGSAIGKEHYRKGWHNTSTLGVIASACAICYMRKYRFMKQALAIAATESFGMRLMFGTTVKPLHAGLAAQCAIQAVELSRLGLGADKDFLDEGLGFLRIYGEGNDGLDLDKFGQPWKIKGLWFKNYPFCSAASYVADAASELHEVYNIGVEDIETADIIFAPKGDEALIYTNPTTKEQGRFSAEYIALLAFSNTHLDFASFSPEAIDEETSRAMRKFTRRYCDTFKSCDKFVVIEILTKSAQKFVRKIDFPSGSVKNPYSKEQMYDKLVKAVKSDILAKKFYDEIELLVFRSDLQALIDVGKKIGDEDEFK
jgi:2-methylcitrate dehydratase PrpD